MHTDIGIPPSVGSLATNVQGRISPLATKMQRWIASLVKKVKKDMVANLSACLPTGFTTQFHPSR